MARLKGDALFEGGRMRVFEMTAHLQKISRASGRSATAAAYRARTVIRCEREGITHDYSRKAGLEAHGIALALFRAGMGSRQVEALERGRDACEYRRNPTTNSDLMPARVPKRSRPPFRDESGHLSC